MLTCSLKTKKDPKTSCWRSQEKKQHQFQFFGTPENQRKLRWRSTTSPTLRFDLGARIVCEGEAAMRHTAPCIEMQTPC